MARPRSWTDTQLRAAVRKASSMTEVVRLVREQSGSAGYRSVRTRIEVLELDVSHFSSQSLAELSKGPLDPLARRSWSLEDLERAVAAATSLNGVFAELGLVVGGSQWLIIRSLIAEHGFSTDHWRHPLHAVRTTSSDWTDEELIAAVAENTSIAGVLRAMNAPRSGWQYRRVEQRAEELGLDTSHMVGQGWRRGRNDVGGRKPTPLGEILVENSTYQNSTNLKERLLAEGVKDHVCEGCCAVGWQGRPIPLELDHINGDRRDNRLENLRLLCPNCHALTETYCGKNQGRYATNSGD